MARRSLRAKRGSEPMTNRTTLLGALAMVLAGCSGLVPPPPPSSPAHLRPDQAPRAGPIPKVVERAPFLPPPVAAPDREVHRGGP